MAEIKNIDAVQLTSVLNKLLDKAGTDARLTPRLLREKAEQRMKLEPGQLIAKKADIMDVIVSWWMENNPQTVEPKAASNNASSDPAALTLQRLSKYAAAVGKGPRFFKDLSQDSDIEKAKDIRKRLQDEGFEVNALPTIEEIDQAKKKYLLKKELADIDPSTVLLKRPRKTLSDDDDNEKNDKNEAEKLSRDQKSQERKEKGKGDHRNGSSVGSPEREKENVSRNLGSPDKKSKLIDDNNDEEEEAEAQF